MLAAVLELSKDVLYRLDKCSKLIEQTHDEHDRTLREMRFAGAANIWLYGHSLSDWIDRMGAWGKRWHSNLISNWITTMPSNCLTMPCRAVTKARRYELAVTWRPQQRPRFGWRFFNSEHPVEFYTHPLPFDIYADFYVREMEHVTMETQYEPG